MGLPKQCSAGVRAAKTLFFLMTMTLSFLFFSAPVFLALTDAILPSALLPSSAAHFHHLRHYDFKSSLVDIPLLSLGRSLLILTAYALCDGLSRRPYLFVATACSLASLAFLSLKASFVFAAPHRPAGGSSSPATVALFCSSYALAVGHVVVAYRTVCRDRKKLLVYKIDIEAVSAYKNGFLLHQKPLLQQERIKK